MSDPHSYEEERPMNSTTKTTTSLPESKAQGIFYGMREDLDEMRELVADLSRAADLLDVRSDDTAESRLRREIEAQREIRRCALAVFAKVHGFGNDVDALEGEFLCPCRFAKMLEAERGAAAEQVKQ
jgi:hypothetical protein